MICDHPFSQRNRTTEGTVGMGVGSDREVGGGDWTKFEKKGRGRQYIGGLHKITRLAPLCELCKETSPIIKPTPPFLAPLICNKNFPSPHYSHF